MFNRTLFNRYPFNRTRTLVFSTGSATIAEIPTPTIKHGQVILAATGGAVASMPTPTVEITVIIQAAIGEATATFLAPAIYIFGTSGTSLSGEFDITESLDGEFVIEVSLSGEFDITESLEGVVNLTKENQDFTMYSGDSKEVTFTVTLPGEGDTLVGTTVKWVLAKGSTVLVTKDNGDNGGVTVTGATTFRVDIEPADTTDLYGQYRHEAQVTDADGDVSTVARGLVTIENDLA